jgi:alkanesulfonate monooxygenase SsuD/methylene tetrahydromethanopterin reductase-like flavin-dependent oxidoreductase (luciferase family)
MKFGIFNAMHYRGTGLPRGNAIPPKLFTPAEWQHSVALNLELFTIADELGFDFVTVAEHHYGTAMTPNPLVAAAAVAQVVKNAKIAVLGPILPILNPVRVAEEFAMVDNLSGGRVIAGFLRGTPHEFMTYGGNPEDSRGQFNEAVELILKCWTEPEPFGWEGVYYRYRTIAVSPRMVQQPYPRVMVSGNSIESLDFAARHRFDIGFSYGNLETCAAHVAMYREKSRAAGWTPAADNVLYRHHCYVAETDARAAEDVARYGFWGAHGGHENQKAALGGPIVIRSSRDLVGALSAEMGHYGKNSAIDMSVSAIVGSPETVTRRIAELARAADIGRVDLIFFHGNLPPERATNSLRLFGREVMPALRRPEGALKREVEAGAATQTATTMRP